jgi:putative heme-binding domain-containing protein
MEVRVAFDGPVDESIAKALAGEAIPFGRQPHAGDPPEPSEPSKKPDGGQQAEPRGTLHIASAELVDDGRTLVLFTDPHPWEAMYTLKLPGTKAPGRGDEAGLDYDLSGITASWREGDGQGDPTWSGWWPHVDPEVVRDLTAGSASHERAMGLLARPGRLEVAGLVTLPQGKVAVRIEASGAIEEASLNFEPAELGEGAREVEFSTESDGSPLDLTLAVRTGEGGKPLTLRVTYRVDDDPDARPVPRESLLVPWAPVLPPAPSGQAAQTPELAGGDPKRGEAVFLGQEGRCSSCHTFRGQGGKIGPDLSDLTGRDAASIYRDIAEPSATIHPDYVPYTVVLKDGRVLSGVVRAEAGGMIRVLDTNAQETRARRDEVEELRPSATSIMPVGLAGALGDRSLRDLLAYLTSEAK